MNLSLLKTIPVEKLFVVIDGSSYLFRAFYAPHLNSLTAPDSAPSGAVYGVLTMLKRLESLLPIHHQGGINAGGQSVSACFVMDEKGGSFRNDIYPKYKAQRSAPPDELISQIEPMKQLVRETGWSLISKAGFEADDLIATLVKQAKAKGKISVIVTGDKDLAQLVDDKVFWLDTMKDEWLDYDGVVKKFGVPPERIIDYLTLIGDVSDNVPGVAKVGPKTAVKWLTEMGTLDDIVKNADNIGGKVGENLRNTLTWLPTAKTLITLKDDVILPDDFAPEFKPANIDALRKSFTRWGFKKMLAEINKKSANNVADTDVVSSATTSSPSLKNLFGEDDNELTVAPINTLPRIDDTDFVCINDEQTLIQWIANLSNPALLAIDTETTGLNPHLDNLVGISLSADGVNAAYIPINHEGADIPQLAVSVVVQHLSAIFENAKIGKCGHNLRFDRIVLSRFGLNLSATTHDTALASFVLEGHSRHSLEEVSRRWLGLGGISFNEVVEESTIKNNIAGSPITKVTTYACEDAALAWLCAKQAESRFSKVPKLLEVYQLELKVSDVLYQMESCGIRINDEFLLEYSKELRHRCAELEQKAHELAGVSFNLASPKQLQEILFNRLGMASSIKTQKGAASTNEEVLERLIKDYPDQLLPKVLLEFRHLAKLNNTYAEKLPKEICPRTNRIHTRFSQVGTITGRLASSEPNVQNIPIKTREGRKIRTAFIAKEGWQLISADYSQVELRVMAHVANDQAMLRAFASGADIHRMTASEVFNLPETEISDENRRYAKAINFGLIYGMSAFGLSKAINVSVLEAKQFIERYFSRYPAIKQWMDDITTTAASQGYVETLLGRQITINGINNHNAHKRQAASRFAINAPIQGSAADIIKLAMIAVADWLVAENMQSKLLLQVHDELVLESPPDEVAHLQKHLPILMQNPRLRLNMTVPLDVHVGVGNDWGSAH